MRTQAAATWLCAIAGPSAAFVALVMPALCSVVSQEASLTLHLAAYAAIATISLLLLLTSCTDPGTLPKGPYNGFAHRYCVACASYAPPRSHHCRVSGRCIARFDHFCSATGSAVGRDNYGAFAALVLAALASAGGVAAGSLAHLRLLAARLAAHEARRSPRWLRAAVAAPASALLLLYGAGVATALALLVGMHLHLRATDQTTHEWLRGADPPHRLAGV